VFVLVGSSDFCTLMALLIMFCVSLVLKMCSLILFHQKSRILENIGARRGYNNFLIRFSNSCGSGPFHTFIIMLTYPILEVIHKENTIIHNFCYYPIVFVFDIRTISCKSQNCILVQNQCPLPLTMPR